jgi:hypothetical protein
MEGSPAPARRPGRWGGPGASPPKVTQRGRCTPTAVSGTLKGFPNPPAMVRGELSSPLPTRSSPDVPTTRSGATLRP